MEHLLNPCCDRVELFDFSKMEIVPVVFQENCFIDFKEPTLWYSVATIVACPLYWNVMGRLEWRQRTISRLCGSEHRGCAVLAFTILLITLYRDVTFNDAMSYQRRWALLQNNSVLWLAYLMLLAGTFLIMRSVVALGLTATFLGDYFGIFLPRRVTSFPYNLLNHPMYVGATMNFTAIALVRCSQAGLFLSCVVGLTYFIAVWLFEAPFTREIYRPVGRETTVTREYRYQSVSRRNDKMD